jgi:hypothetical protein
MTLPWMVQNESLLIEQEEHGPGPKPPDPMGMKTCCSFQADHVWRELQLPLRSNRHATGTSVYRA